MTSIRFFPARVTWHAKTVELALVQLGYSQDEAATLIAACGMDNLPVAGIKSLTINRSDMPERPDVLIPYGNEQGDAVVAVAEGYREFEADTEEQASTNWPYSGANIFLIAQAAGGWA